ncbi:transposable element Tcb2 transposase [Trichonephila clavipes]|nr:transposable element Tcb2 transposase [Trichonephila clavipes]
MKSFSQFERRRIIGMMGTWGLARRVARQLGRSDCIVKRCWDQQIREMSFTRRPGLGRPQQTTTSGPYVFPNHTKVPGRRTFGIAAPITCAALDAHPSMPPFGVVPRTRKLDCAAEWNQVIFSDKSRFDLSSDDNRVRVWRPRGERFNPGFALQRHTAPTVGVMVWGAIANNTRSPLVLIRGTMRAQHVHDILQPHVLPLMQRLPRAIFQQGNARPHTTRVSQDCLRIVTTFPSPVRSPDLS